ncbi:hypothetical protein [Dyadobacter linearis]|nr:hypothetical protein [Dyadobacter sp. CECT 9623]
MDYKGYPEISRGSTIVGWKIPNHRKPSPDGQPPIGIFPDMILRRD